jgi:PAS domain S-box-containing protein
VVTGEAVVSPLWKRILGYDDGEISATFEEWNALIHPQDLDRVLAALTRFLQSDTDIYQADFRMRCKDGSYRWIASRGMAAARDGDGRPLRILGVHRDIAEQVGERKLAEDSLCKLNRVLAKKRNQLRDLAAQNEAARERERKHIAREVHDELGQILTALRMDTTIIAMRFGATNAALNRKVSGLRNLIDTAIQGVRDVATHLRPMALDMGLYLALDWLCKDFSQRCGVPCALETRDPTLQLDEGRAVVVFRIVQESLTNICRYAQASEVLVTFDLQGSQLCVAVQDNGVGFDFEKVKGAHSFGLLGMKERALALGGRVDIASAPGQGTRICLTMPYALCIEGAQP